jgi:hypothetical protein
MGSMFGDIYTERFKDRPLPAGVATPRTVLATEDGIILAYGITVPSDAATGYAIGCIFIHTDASGSGFIYINEGSSTSADFNYVAAGT